MRKWHRWVSLVLFLPILFIALTGVASQFADIYAKGGLGEPERPRSPGAPAAPSAALMLIPAAQAHEGEAHEEAEEEAPPQANALAAPSGAVATLPAPARRPPPTAAQRLVGTLHHLHSGESFGPVGTIVSIVAGFALTFFAISGMWMYIQMFRARVRRTGSKEVFWK